MSRIRDKSHGVVPIMLASILAPTTMILLLFPITKPARTMGRTLLLLLILTSCGDGGGKQTLQSGTPPGDYELTITVAPEIGAPTRMSLSLHVK